MISCRIVPRLEPVGVSTEQDQSVPGRILVRRICKIKGFNCQVGSVHVESFNLKERMIKL